MLANMGVSLLMDPLRFVFCPFGFPFKPLKMEATLRRRPACLPGTVMEGIIESFHLDEPVVYEVL